MKKGNSLQSAIENMQLILGHDLDAEKKYVAKEITKAHVTKYRRIVSGLLSEDEKDVLTLELSMEKLPENKLMAILSAAKRAKDLSRV